MILDRTIEERPTLTASWFSSLEPPPRLTVSEWAELHRRLPETSAARGGKWLNATTPYLAGIMDAALDPRVRKLALMKCHQSGGSEALQNVIGYHIQHDPCPMLVVHPTAGAAEAYSKERLADMIRGTPELAAVVRDRAQPRALGQAESTLALKMFPGGFLALGGANTPNTFARWSVRLAIGDDVDRFPPVVGDEGDPADLLSNRTTSFYDALSIFVSTPTLRRGRIDTLYARSDQRRYFLRCPQCGREDWVTWGDPAHWRVVYDGADPETARLECPPEDHGGCGSRMYEPARRAAVAVGEWRATATAAEPGLAGFHLPAMISTLGDVTLPGLVAKWLGARERGHEALRVFINTSLGEGWEERGTRVESHALLHRRESYGSDVDVPAPAVCLTAGVDVQVDRFEVQVIGWGPAGERWVIDPQRVVPGDPRRTETQAALMETLAGRYRHASGHMLPILAACVDTGYATEEMYDLVLAHQHRRLYATKGVAGRAGDVLVSKPSEKRYGRRPRPVRLYTINVDDAKADFLAAIAKTESGPGAMHFPDGADEEYLAQLCAEHRETRYAKSGVATHSVWVQDRERNEALDTAVLCLAAFRLLNPNLQHLAQVLDATKPGRDPAPGGGQPPPQTSRPQRPRAARSSYLGR